MLLDATTHLRDGSRVRVRLPHAGDADALALLHVRLGVSMGDLELARLLRFDPRRRAVAVATTWTGGTEAVVGYGAIDRAAGTPDLVVSDEDLAPGVRDLLVAVLAEHADGRHAA